MAAASNTIRPRKLYTRAEVRRHNKPDDCWVIIAERVYDVTSYLPTHPGGGSLITAHAGEDITYEFGDKPHSKKAIKLLDLFKIGRVQRRVRVDPSAASIATPAIAAAGAGSMDVDSGGGGGGGAAAIAAAHASAHASALSGRPIVRIDYSLIDNHNYNTGAPPPSTVSTAAAAAVAAPPNRARSTAGHDRPKPASAAASASSSSSSAAAAMSDSGIPNDDPFRANFPTSTTAASGAAAAAAPAAGGGGFSITLTSPNAAAVPLGTIVTSPSASSIRLPNAVLNVAPPAIVAAHNAQIPIASASASSAAAASGATAASGTAAATANGKAKIDEADLISSLRKQQKTAEFAKPVSLKPLMLKGEITKRKKEPLDPGCSPMHWAELINRMPRRPLQKISRKELAKHASLGDAWMALRGKVYDITDYVRFHPGGKTELMRGAGIDGTALFDSTHHWINIDYLLEKCMIGVLSG